MSVSSGIVFGVSRDQGGCESSKDQAGNLRHAILTHYIFWSVHNIGKGNVYVGV